ncbi:methyltransferase-like 26 isoform X1 [Mytilus californianus]|uniref:methyltransferase-like 26 isoform X1 n=2 Tax=Mytilus californianus TaxID=6549 RepID=UPI0022455C2F|nr:methyltransferase-like 26 isoform X1 [Mytilus californianus]
MISKQLLKQLLNTRMFHVPAAERNKEPILKVLQKYIPQGFKGRALEVASGAGVHVAHFAQFYPNITWQPTEYDQKTLGSISAYIAHTGVKNVHPPLHVDITTPPEDLKIDTISPGNVDIIDNINMIHISPWETAIGLFRTAKYFLRPAGYLFLYGPFAIQGTITPDSNVQFDSSLRARDSQWGLRDIDDVKKLAEENGLKFLEMIDMPANNKTVIFQKNS